MWHKGCSKFEQNEGKEKGYFNCNVFSTDLESMHLQFDISRLCTRVVLILLLVDF